MVHPKWLVSFTLVLCLLGAVGCAGKPEAQISWRPPIPLPVKLVLSTSGKVSIEGDASMATPLGTFSIGAGVPVADFDPNRDVLLVLEDRNRGTQQVFRVYTGQEARIVANGTTVVRVGSDRRVVIDVTNSAIQTVEINSQGSQSSAGAPGNPPAAAPQPRSAPVQPASQPATVFEDHFNGSTLNSSNWTLDNFERNSVSVSGSALHLASSGDRTPYIYNRSNPFPSSGDFRFTLRYGYSNVAVCGASVSLTSGFLPPFIQGQSPSIFEAGSKVSFFIWHEVIWYDTQSGRRNILLPGGYTSPHEMVIEYRANRYQVIQDGSSIYTSDSTNARPRYVAFGNAAIQTNTCPWDSLDIDLVRVERLP